MLSVSVTEATEEEDVDPEAAAPLEHELDER